MAVIDLPGPAGPQGPTGPSAGFVYLPGEPDHTISPAYYDTTAKHVRYWDGVAWRQWFPPGTVPRMVALSYDGYVATSADDGRTWVQSRPPWFFPDDGYAAFDQLIYARGLFTATGWWRGGPCLATSSDGIVWIDLSAALGAAASGLPKCYGAGLYVAGATFAQSSPDMSTWSPLVQLTANTIFGQPPQYGVYGATAGFVLTNQWGLCYVSPDGLTWTFGGDATMPGAVGYHNAVFSRPAYGATAAGPSGVGVFVAACDRTPPVVVTSRDGKHWTDTLCPSITASLTQPCVAYGPNVWVALGHNSQAWVATDPEVGWDAYDMPTPRAWESLGYNNSVFAAIAGDTVAVSPDGITWTEYAMPSAKRWISVAGPN